MTVTFAGRELLAPGGHIMAENYGGSRSFTAAAEPLLNAEAASVRSYGNAQGSLTLPIGVDFHSEYEAIAYAMQAVRHAELQTVGELCLTVDDPDPKLGRVEYAWQAGISSLDWSIQYVGYDDSSRVRLQLNYSFTLGQMM